MSKLVRRPIPLPDESPAALLLRAGESNGWQSHLLVSQYLSHPDMQLAYVVTRRSVFNSVVQDMGIEGAGGLAYAATRPTEKSPVRWKGLVAPKAAIRLTTCAVCPACLAEDAEPYGRATWDLRLIRSCSRHQIQLVERCDACGEAIRWSRRKLCVCRCGYDYRLSPRRHSIAVEVAFIEEAVRLQDSDLLNTAWAMDTVISRLQSAESIEVKTMDERASLLCEAVRSPDHFAARLAPHSALDQSVAARVAFRELFEVSGFKRYGLPIFEALDTAGRGAIGGRWSTDLMKQVSVEQAARIIGSRRITSRLIQAGMLSPPGSTALENSSIRLEELSGVMVALYEPQHAHGVRLRLRPIQGKH